MFNNELSSSQPICALPFTGTLSSECSAESTGPWSSNYVTNLWGDEIENIIKSKQSLPKEVSGSEATF